MEKLSGKIVIEKVVKFYTFMFDDKKNEKNGKKNKKRKRKRKKLEAYLNQLMYSFVLSGRYHHYLLYYIYGLNGSWPLWERQLRLFFDWDFIEYNSCLPKSVCFKC